jgi:hypothetical protein
MSCDLVDHVIFLNFCRNVVLIFNKIGKRIFNLLFGKGTPSLLL